MLIFVTSTPIEAEVDLKNFFRTQPFNCVSKACCVSLSKLKKRKSVPLFLLSSHLHKNTLESVNCRDDPDSL